MMKNPLKVLVLATAFLVAADAQGQLQANSGNAKTYIQPTSLPSVLQPVAKALGERVSKPGQERSTFVGTMEAGGVKSAITVIRELPDKIRIERGGKPGAGVYNSEKTFAAATLDELDQDLLEMLTFDTSEKFLLTVATEAMPRLIGHRFAVPGVTGFGALVDLYELHGAVPTRGKDLARAKQFMFDSETGLLRRVAYTILKNGATVRVETEYGNYRAVNGNPMPQSVKRREGNTITIDVTFTTTLLQQQAADSVFGN